MLLVDGSPSGLGRRTIGHVISDAPLKPIASPKSPPKPHRAIPSPTPPSLAHDAPAREIQMGWNRVPSAPAAHQQPGPLRQTLVHVSPTRRPPLPAPGTRETYQPAVPPQTSRRQVPDADPHGATHARPQATLTNSAPSVGQGDPCTWHPPKQPDQEVPAKIRCQMAHGSHV